MAFDEFIPKNVDFSGMALTLLYPTFIQMACILCLEVKHGSYVSRQQLTGLCRNMGSFNNYVDKKRREGVIRKSTLGHVTKARYHVKCPQLSTRGGEGGQNLLNLVHIVDK